MIPDVEAVCQTSETAVDIGDIYEKIKDRPEKEVASVTAWNRYQRLMAAMESRGSKFNRKSVIEAIFRGSDLVYVTHWSADQSNASPTFLARTKSASQYQIAFAQWCRTRKYIVVLFKYESMCEHLVKFFEKRKYFHYFLLRWYNNGIITLWVLLKN